MANNELLKLTAHQVKEKKFDKAILSVGSCEAHGQHLAEGTDTLVSYMLSCNIAESVIRNGINHIFIMNGHDGNIAPIEIASRKLKEQYPDVKIACLPQWWVTAGELLPPDTFEVWNGLGHAGEGESSIAYYLYPQWNEPDQAKGFVPDCLPDYVEMKWDFSELTNCAATGDPTKATPEKGEKMTKVLVDACVKAINELDACGWDYRTSGIR